MAQSLTKKAQAAGVAVEEKSCGTCGGQGALLWPDPVDLRRLRTRRNVGYQSFATFAGISAAYVLRIETDDPKIRRRCPEEVLAKYLEIDQAVADGRLAPKSRHDYGPAMGSKVKLTPEEKAERLEKRKRAERRQVRNGSHWKRIFPPTPPAIVEVVKVFEGLAILHDVTGGRHRTIKLKTLLNRYQEIAP